MEKFRDFFEMTRHERRGAIMVLLLIAALLAATCAMRCSREPAPSVPVVDIRQFENEADSINLVQPKPSHKKPAAPNKKRRHASPKPSKPAPEPRPIDPVPQF